MLNIGISEFRANMNDILQKVQQGTLVTLTSSGIAIARLVPPDFAQLVARQELEQLSKTAVVDDILTPIDTN